MIALVVVTAVVGLVGYGIATRRQRTAAAMERADPTRLTAASDAGKAIAAEIPARMITGRNLRQLRISRNCKFRNSLGFIPRSARVLHRMRAYPPPPQPQPVRESSAEEKARIAAYRQELDALAAPTAIGGNLGGVGRDWRRFTADPRGRPRTDDDAAEDNAGTRGATRSVNLRGTGSEERSL